MLVVLVPSVTGWLGCVPVWLGPLVVWLVSLVFFVVWLGHLVACWHDGFFVI